MKGRFIFILFLLFSVLAFNFLEAQTGAAKGKGRVKGKITDPAGKPVAGATVRFASSSLETSFDVTTNEKGEWVVNGLAGGAWDLDFAKEGFETKKISAQVQTLGYNKPIEITLQKAAGKAPSSVATGSGPGATAADPAKLLIQEGTVLADEKKYAEAIAKYEQAVKLNPAMHLLYGEIGNLYVQMGEPDKAIEAYKKLLEKDAANQGARLSIVTVLLEKNNIEEAKKMLDGLDLNTITNASTLYEIGVRFYNAKDTKEAMKYWEKAIAVDAKLIDAYVQLGAAYVSTGDNEKAKQMLKKAIELDPNSDGAKMAQEMLNSLP